MVRPGFYATVHRWIGLVLAVFWAVQGLTGAALAFRDELDELLNPDFAPSFARGPCAGNAAVADVAAAAQRAARGDRVERIAAGQNERCIYSVRVHSAAGATLEVIVDAADASVLGVRPWQGDFTRAGLPRLIYTWHRDMLWGRNGMNLLGVSGVFLLATVLLGLRIGWPRKGSWRAAFRIPWRAPAPASLYALHRSTGLFVGVLLLISAITGIYLAWSQPVRVAVSRIVSHSMTPDVRSADTTGDRIGIDAALTRARAEFPQARLVAITLPNVTNGVYAVRLRQPGEIRRVAGTTEVVIDEYSGAVLHRHDAIHQPASNDAIDALFPLHTGELGGLVTRIVTVLSGLALSGLCVTGALRFFVRTARSKRSS